MRGYDIQRQCQGCYISWRLTSAKILEMANTFSNFSIGCVSYLIRRHADIARTDIYPSQANCATLIPQKEIFYFTAQKTDKRVQSKKLPYVTQFAR